MLRTARLGLAAIVAGLALAVSGTAPAPAPAQEQAKGQQYAVYFGTYTTNLSKGIYLSFFDTATGKLSEPMLVAELKNPSFLAIHPNGKRLYVVSEIGGKQGGGLTEFSIDGRGGLTKLVTVPTLGDAPCHVNLDPTGKVVLVANYTGGSVAAFPITDKGLGEASSLIQHRGSSVNKQRQEAPHAHSVNVDPTGKFVVAADLGTDELLVYKLDVNQAKLTPNDPPSTKVKAGGGPRHFTFHPKLPYAYTNNELTSSVTALTWDAAKGTLSEIQEISTLPSDYKQPGNTTAEIVVHPSGRFLYCSNRGHNSIAMFRIDQQTGKLTLLGHQTDNIKIPRNFAIEPSGQFMLVASQAADHVGVFRINQETGLLEPTGQRVTVGAPVCVRFLRWPVAGLRE
jgi:6-phosphogluconolactonase